MLQVKASDSVNSRDDFSSIHEASSGQTVSREQPCIGLEVELESDYGCQEDASCASECGTNVFEHVTEDTAVNQKLYKDKVVINAKVAEESLSPGTISNGGNYRQKNALRSNATKVFKPSKSAARSSLEQYENGKPGELLYDTKNHVLLCSLLLTLLLFSSDG